MCAISRNMRLWKNSPYGESIKRLFLYKNFVNAVRWEEYYENVIAVMEGKADPIVTHEQIMRAMRVLMVAFESARNNQTVKLD